MIKRDTTHADEPWGSEEAARWALAKVKPDYFGWPKEAQACFRSGMDRQVRLAVEQELLAVLFGIYADTAEEIHAAQESMDPKRKAAFEKALLFCSGVGEDYFRSDEVAQETGRSTATFRTLSEFDLILYAHQRKVSCLADYEYQGELNGVDAAILIDGEPRTIQLFTAANYIQRCVSDAGSTRWGQLESGGWSRQPGEPTSRRQAKFKSREMYERFERYRTERHRHFAGRFQSAHTRAVYMVPGASEQRPGTLFVFSDSTVLEEIRFRHFLSDCNRILQPPTELDAIVEHEKKAVWSFVEAQFTEICAIHIRGSGRR